MATSKDGISVNCLDLGAVMTKIANLRKADDSIILELNDALPTRSFGATTEKCRKKCEELRNTLERMFRERVEMVERCVEENRKRAAQIEDSSPIEARLAKTTMRSLRNELDVDQVVRERTMTALNERCGRI